MTHQLLFSASKVKIWQHVERTLLVAIDLLAWFTLYFRWNSGAVSDGFCHQNKVLLLASVTVKSLTAHHMSTMSRWLSSAFGSEYLWLLNPPTCRRQWECPGFVADLYLFWCVLKQSVNSRTLLSDLFISCRHAANLSETFSDTWHTPGTLCLKWTEVDENHK